MLQDMDLEKDEELIEPVKGQLVVLKKLVLPLSWCVVWGGGRCTSLFKKNLWLNSSLLLTLVPVPGQQEDDEDEEPPPPEPFEYTED